MTSTIDMIEESRNEPGVNERAASTNRPVKVSASRVISHQNPELNRTVALTNHCQQELEVQDFPRFEVEAPRWHFPHIRTVEGVEKLSGLFLIYEPEETHDTKFDVVAIHSIGGHAIRSWTH